ncbi:hypothetical protein BU17DRAFT_102536 [Hysterangium stoloniferum]|nr:hypothetical protein BU17DRAFT_102536 [Hysterangium stoloniferum]
MSFLKATWDSICSIGKRSSTPRREDPTQDPPRGASPSPTLPQYFDAWDDISWDILSETPLGETDESIDSPPPLYEDTMASIPSYSQEVRQALNSGSTTDVWLYSRKSPSPPLDDAEDHLSTISDHGYAKFLDGTKEDTHLQIVRKSFDNSSMIPSLSSESSFDWSDVNIPDSNIVERVHYGSQNGDVNNITQGPTKSHSAKRQREDNNPRSEPPKRKRTTSPPIVSPSHHPAISRKRKVDDNDDDIPQKLHPPNQQSTTAKRQRIASNSRRSNQNDGAIEKDNNEELPGPSRPAGVRARYGSDRSQVQGKKLRTPRNDTSNREEKQGDKVHMCSMCPSSRFTRATDLKRHLDTARQHNPVAQHVCPTCKATFPRKDTMQRHFKQYHGDS